jgi:Ca-activated chloride channel homolog
MCLAGVQIPKPAQDASGNMVDQEELMTAIGDGLATACARLEKAEPVSKIIVLLSDGESNAGAIEPLEAMKAAQKLGIKVYTIGVGSNQRRTLVRVRDGYGREQLMPAAFRLDEALLRKIAAETGGDYFQVQNADGLEQALKKIDELEKTEVERDIYYEYDEWFPALLMAALGLVVVGTSLNMLVTKRIV